MRKILSKGADVNWRKDVAGIRDNGGDSPLTVVVSRGHAECLQIILGWILTLWIATADTRSVFNNLEESSNAIMVSISQGEEPYGDQGPAVDLQECPEENDSP